MLVQWKIELDNINSQWIRIKDFVSKNVLIFLLCVVFVIYLHTVEWGNEQYQTTAADPIAFTYVQSYCIPYTF